MVFCRRIFLSAALLVFLCAAPGMGAKDWEILGQQDVDFKGDRDTIKVGRQEGMFRQLRIEVRGGPIEMYDMVVTFGNKTKFSPDLRLKFDENSTSRIIDLPGERRNILRIDFRYRSTKRGEGKGRVLVYGR
jgi:hypothetical protein